MPHSTFYTLHSSRVLRATERGQAALITMLFFLTISSVVVFSITHAALTQARISRDLINSKRAIAAAESGLERVALALAQRTALEGSYVIDYGAQQITATISTAEESSGVRYSSSAVGASNLYRKSSMLVQGGALHFPFTVMTGTGGLDVKGDSLIFSVNANEALSAHISGNITSNNTKVHISNASVQLLGNFVSPASVAQTCNTACQQTYVPQNFPTLSSRVMAMTSLSCANTTHTTQNQEQKNIGNTDGSPYCIGGGSGTVLTVKNSGKLTLLSDLYIYGDVVLQDNCFVYASDIPRLLVVSGTVTIKNSCDATGDGAQTPSNYNGSNPVRLSTADKLAIISLSSSDSAILIQGTKGSATVLFAQNGTITMKDAGSAIAVYAKELKMQDNAEIRYNADVNERFTTGYQFLQWKERE